MFGFSNHSFWYAWRGIASIFPTWLIYPGMVEQLGNDVRIGVTGVDASSQFDLLVDINNLKNSLSAEVKKYSQHGKSGVPLNIIMSESFFLERQHKVPIQSNKDINKILALNIAQKTPFSAQDIVWRSKQTGRYRGQANYSQMIIKASVLKTIESGFAFNGWKVRNIRIDGSGIIFIDNSRQTDRMYQIWNRIAALAAITAVGAIFSTAYFRYEAQSAHLDRLNIEVSAFQDQAIALHSDANAEKKSQDQISNLAARFIQNRQALQVLSALTNELSDEFWLAQLSMRSDEIRIAGFTTSAPSGLIEILEKNPLFFQPRLSGPVVRDQRLEIDRFELNMRVAEFYE